VASPDLISELDEVLHRRKFARLISTTDADRAVTEFRRTAEMHYPEEAPRPISRDRDDDYLVALALYARADMLVAGHASASLEPCLTNFWLRIHRRESDRCVLPVQLELRRWLFVPSHQPVLPHLHLGGVGPIGFSLSADEDGPLVGTRSLRRLVRLGQYEDRVTPTGWLDNDDQDLLAVDRDIRRSR
jgi:hypothetical protein